MRNAAYDEFVTALTQAEVLLRPSSEKKPSRYEHWFPNYYTTKIVASPKWHGRPRFQTNSAASAKERGDGACGRRNKLLALDDPVLKGGYEVGIAWAITCGRRDALF
jgi:hypothetical protein